MLQDQPDNPELSENQVHLWLAAVREWLPARDALLELLQGDEIQRLERYKIAEKREQFMISRGLLRKVLAGYLQEDPAGIPLQISEDGKPTLPERNIQFNLSHSGDWLLLGITRSGEIGVDLQEMYSISSLDTLIRNYFSDQEISYLDSLSPHNRLEGFFAIWTAKEAYLKARGKGFSYSPRSFDLLPGAGAENAFSLGRAQADDADLPWTILGLDLPDNYRGAVAVCGPVQEILQYRLAPGSSS